MSTKSYLCNLQAIKAKASRAIEAADKVVQVVIVRLLPGHGKNHAIHK
jgi:hypothetical protein